MDAFLGDAYKEDASLLQRSFGIAITDSPFYYVPSTEAGDMCEPQMEAVVGLKENNDIPMLDQRRIVIATNSMYTCYVVKGNQIRVLSPQTSNKLLLKGHDSTVLDMKIAESVAERQSRETVNLYFAESKKINFFLNQKTKFPKLFYFWKSTNDRKKVEKNLTVICNIFKKFRKRGLKVFTVCICNEAQSETAHQILKNAELSALNYYTTNLDKLDVEKIKPKGCKDHFIRLIGKNNSLDYGVIENVEFSILNNSVLLSLNNEND